MPLNPSWKELNPDIPDSRAKRSLNEKKHKLLGWMEEIFCINCGVSGGMITKDWAQYCQYLCDNCVYKYGHLPLPTIPDDTVRGR